MTTFAVFEDAGQEYLNAVKGIGRIGGAVPSDKAHYITFKKTFNFEGHFTAVDYKILKIAQFFPFRYGSCLL